MIAGLTGLLTYPHVTLMAVNGHETCEPCNGRHQAHMRLSPITLLPDGDGIESRDTYCCLATANSVMSTVERDRLVCVVAGLFVDSLPIDPLQIHAQAVLPQIERYFDPLKLTGARRAHGWTKAELGRVAQISRSSIGQWESGYYVPEERSVKKLAVALGLDPEELFAIEQDWS